MFRNKTQQQTSLNEGKKTIKTTLPCTFLRMNIYGVDVMTVWKYEKMVEGGVDRVVKAISYRILLRSSQAKHWNFWVLSFHVQQFCWLWTKMVWHGRWPNYPIAFVDFVHWHLGWLFRCAASIQFGHSPYIVFYCVDSAWIVWIETQCNYYYHDSYVVCRHF